MAVQEEQDADGREQQAAGDDGDDDRAGRLDAGTTQLPADASRIGARVQRRRSADERHVRVAGG